MRYYIPEWEDRVDPDYDFIEEKYSKVHLADKANDVYMWEIFGTDRTPFDGVLVSLMSVIGNGEKEEKIRRAGGLHKYLRLPERFPILADCGAWGYIKEEHPPFDATKVLEHYRDFGVQEAVTVDHLVIPKFTIKERTIKVDTQQRMGITYENGIKGFKAWKNYYEQYFNLLVSVQGLNVKDYLGMYRKYSAHGITSFAFGGLAKKPNYLVVKIIDELLREIRRQRFKPERIHFFGLGRPNLFFKFKEFEELGVAVSFDTASWLRKAWLSGHYYLVDRGRLHTYTAIRVPITDANRSSFRGKRKLSQATNLEGLQEFEQKCLTTLRAYEKGNATLDGTLSSVKRFNDKLLQEFRNAFSERISDSAERSRKISELDIFFKKLEKQYEATLRDCPWTKCDCEICRNIRIEVILFRGNNRNRRRGFHNVFTIYHKFLNNPVIWKLPFNFKGEISAIDPEELAKLSGRVLIVTECTKTKLGYDSTVMAKAEDMYQGRLFKAVKSFCKIKNFPFVIISAKYGLISPDDTIKGYEDVLRTRNDIEQIKSKVTDRLSKLLPQFDKVVVIAGQNYRETLRDIWDNRFTYLKARGYADLCKIIEQIVSEISGPKLSAFITND